MASILTRTQNGIVFDHINNTEGTLQVPLKITQTSELLDYMLIDAVNIDWNNAYLPQNCSYINTTGDLLKLIDKLKQDADAQSSLLEWEIYNGN